jgi:hypothetical protein
MQTYREFPLRIPVGVQFRPQLRQMQHADETHELIAATRRMLREPRGGGRYTWVVLGCAALLIAAIGGVAALVC